MKHPRFELSSEQTLRLAELRDALAKVVPADVAETVEFPVAYGCVDCGLTCIGTCKTSCGGNCTTNCGGGCKVVCWTVCIDGCLGSMPWSPPSG